MGNKARCKGQPEDHMQQTSFAFMTRETSRLFPGHWDQCYSRDLVLSIWTQLHKFNRLSYRPDKTLFGLMGNSRQT